MYAIIKFKDLQALGEFEKATDSVSGLELYPISSPTGGGIFRLMKYFNPATKNLYEYFLALGAFEEVALS